MHVGLPNVGFQFSPFIFPEVRSELQRVGDAWKASELRCGNCSDSFACCCWTQPLRFPPQRPTDFRPSL